MARIINGTYRLPSGLTEELNKHSLPTLGLFFKLLYWANWVTSKFVLEGMFLELAPGQLVTSREELAEAVGVSVKVIRRGLAYLVSRGLIIQSTSNRGRLITIVNFTQYEREADFETLKGPPKYSKRAN